MEIRSYDQLNFFNISNLDYILLDEHFELCTLYFTSTGGIKGLPICFYHEIKKAILSDNPYLYEFDNGDFVRVF
jgi:hypothetical protein